VAARPPTRKDSAGRPGVRAGQARGADGRHGGWRRGHPGAVPFPSPYIFLDSYFLGHCNLRWVTCG